MVQKGESRVKKRIRVSFCIVIILTLLLGQSISAADIAGERNEEAAETQIQKESSVSEQEEAEQEKTPEEKVEEKIEEWSEDTNKGYDIGDEDIISSNMMKQNLIVYKGIPIRISLQAPTGTYWYAESDDGSICRVVQQTGYGYASGSTSYRVDIELEAVNSGITKVKLTDYDNVVAEIAITVREMPENAVLIKDAYLNGMLLGIIEDTTSYDENKDGYLSFEEIKQIKSLTIPPHEVEDLSGVEYAENLESISLYGNENIKDVTPLKKLKKLVDINLRGTHISEQDRWELADFKDITVNPGQILCLPLRGNLFEVEDYNKASIDVTVLSGDGSVIQKSYISDGKIYYIVVASGKVEVKVQYKTFSKNIVINVEGKSPEQQVGNIYNGTSDIGYKYTEGKETEVTILKQNGELWRLNPKVEKIADGVEKQFFGTSYVEGTNQQVGYFYYLDKDGTLWSDGIALASHVKTCDGRYALSTDNSLLDLYAEGAVVLDNVEKWQQTIKTYVLKKDGSLWVREEVNKGESANQFKCVARDVKDMNNYYYITTDGTLYLLSGDSAEKSIKVKYLLGLESGREGYYGEDGWTRVDGYGAIIDEPAKEIYGWYYPEMAFLVRTQNNQLFRVVRVEGGYKKQHLTNDFDSWIIASNDCAYRTKDGNYYNQLGTMLTPSKENPIVMQILTSYNSNIYQVMNEGDEDNLYVVKNGIRLLNYVKNVFHTSYYGLDQGKRVYAERTDGTIWDITTVPEQILATAVLVKGDITGDGQTTLSDLMMVLRCVSGRETLKPEQLKAADVTGDGKITLTDLMKILQFVNHKIPEL